MVNKENVRLWVEELRSGNFQQTTEMLREWRPGPDGHAYCCLGVACELYRLQTGLGEWRLEEGQLDEFAIGDDSSKYTMPRSVYEWLGLEDEAQPYAPIIQGHGKSLAGLNDDGLSFAEIADIIESTWLGEGDDDA